MTLEDDYIAENRRRGLPDDFRPSGGLAPKMPDEPMSHDPEPLSAEALEQVRGMLTVSAAGYHDQNTILLLGVARKLLATLDAERAALLPVGDDTPSLDGLTVGDDGRYHCGGCDAHDLLAATPRRTDL